MPDPRFIELDTETYGSCKEDAEGRPLPIQRFFHPRRSLHGDRPATLLLSAAITLPEVSCLAPTAATASPVCPPTASPAAPNAAIPGPHAHPATVNPSSGGRSLWDAQSLAQLVPSESMVFLLHNPLHLRLLIRWLEYAHSLGLMNAVFDITNLRTIPELRLLLDGRHTIIDMGIINYLHNEERPERSLKTVGPVLGLFTYEGTPTLKNGFRFDNPFDERFIKYNPSDTHNAMLGKCELSRRIIHDFLCPTTNPTSSSSSSNSSNDGTTTTPSPSRTTSPPTETASPSSETSSRSSKSPSCTTSVPSPPLTSQATRIGSNATSSATTSISARGATSTSIPLDTKPKDSESPMVPSPTIPTCPSGPSASLPTNGNTSATTSWKLSSRCIDFFSDSIWSVVRMTEAGVPMDRSKVEHLQRIQLFKAHLASKVALSKYGLLLNGDGSDKSKGELIERLLADCLPINAAGDPVEEHPLFEYTDKEARISFNDLNRLLIKHHLPTKHWGREVLNLWDIQSSAQKLVSSYTFPLLHHRRTKPGDTTTILLPLCLKPSQPSSPSSSSSLESPASLPERVQSSTEKVRKRTPKQYAKRHKDRQTRRSNTKKGETARRKAAACPLYDEPRRYHKFDPPPTVPGKASPTNVELAFSKWFIFPGPYDSTDKEGGQKQGRLSAKDPAAQTFPPPIRSCIHSRFRDGWIAAWDVDQAELRTAGVLSGEPTIINAYTNKLDLHVERAIKVFAEDFNDRFPPELLDAWYRKREKGHPLREEFDFEFRQPGKHSNFADLFWASADTLQRTFIVKSGIYKPLDVCQRIVDARPSTRPVLYAWQKELIARVKRDGRLELPFTGISRWFMGGEKFEDNEIINMPVQAHAAICVRYIQHWIDKNFLPPLSHPDPSILCFANVYDACKYDCRTQSDVEGLKQAVAAAFDWVQRDGYWAWLQSHTGHTIPLTYDFTAHQ